MGLQPGSFLGPYEIRSVIRAGLTGELYAARDPDADCKVAIMPLVRRGTADPKKHERLLDQAASAATLSHPNIATLLDVAESDDELYAIYEHVSGSALRTLLSRRHLSPRRSVGLVIHVADAVAEAHAAGILHGCLTSDIVIVAANGSAKVLGFGLTVAEADDPLKDVAALGGMLFEMLHGRPPSPRMQKTLPAGSSGIAALADADAEIPGELHGIVTRALADTAEGGSGSADALAAELRAVAAILDVRGEVKQEAAPPKRSFFNGAFRRKQEKDE